MTITEKVAYLKGLMEGMKIDPESNEGKLWKAIMDVLADLALSVEDLEDYTSELTEQVDAIDEDLDQLEMDYYEDYEDYDDDCDCGCHHDDDERFHCGKQCLGRRLHLFIIICCDFVEHVFHITGFLADLYHMVDHRWEDPGICQWLRERDSTADLFGRIF